MINFIKSLFFSHYMVFTEKELYDKYDFEPQIGVIDYSEDKVRRDFSDPISCELCGEYQDHTTTEINTILEGRMVEINREAHCQPCNHTSKLDIRLKDGYIMTKRDNEWLVIIFVKSKIAQFLDTLF